MIRQPVERSVPGRIGTIRTPIRGWSTRDLDDSKYARILTNLYPLAGKLVMRKGHAEHVTGLGSDVETLMEYSAGATSVLFGAAGTSVFDVTSSGAVGAASLASLTNARLQHTMFATAAGTFLVFVNGADGVRTYNGSVWATQSITGATAADLTNIWAHKFRLWFVEGNSLSVWYLPVIVVAGAAVELDLGPLCTLGGTLLAGGTWTFDGGDGVDDLWVAVTTQGQVIVYAGTDPSSASTWGLIGVYKVDRPLGKRCLRKIGADLHILTESGPITLRDVMSGRAERDQFANPIRDEFIVAATETGSSFGWEVSESPSNAWIIVNIPTGQADQYDQHVFVQGSGWWKAHGLNGVCWHEKGGALYFGGTDGTVYQANTGQDDDDAAIVCDYQPAWSDFGTPRNKQFTMVRPNFFSDGIPDPSIDMRVDYDDRPATSDFNTTVTSVGAEWDAEDWDDAIWGGGMFAIAQWGSAVGLGIVGAPRIRFQSTTTELAIASVDVLYEPGGVI